MDKMDNKCEKAPKLQRFRSEEEFAQTWDRCLTDMIVKMGGGVGLGIVFSLFLFGRRGWPIYFGMGTGFGIAYNNCQTAFNGALQSHQLRSRCSPQIQLAKRRCEKIDPCKRGGGRPVPVVLECVEEIANVVPSCDSSKREEPWTAHTSYGQVTDHGIYNPTHPHFNTVGHSQQTVPPCPPPGECPPSCDKSCSIDPRDSCRFKTRM